jgi:hypothetical protein
VIIFIITRKDYMKTSNVWGDIGPASCWRPWLISKRNRFKAVGICNNEEDEEFLRYHQILKE